MALTGLAAVAAHFGRDVNRALVKIEGIIEDAREARVSLLVLPDATLGGYLADMSHPDPAALPPAVAIDGPEIRRISNLAGDMIVCVGFTEELVVDGELRRYNTAVAVNGDGILGTHRKVHQPLGESLVYWPGDSFDAFDTPIGRMGMLIDYDKTFPEAARTLALDGAVIVACLSAWPASVTDRAERMQQDRQSRLFDLYDCARAAENQIIVVSSNQTGVTGGLRFLGQAKVVGPGGDVLSRTWSRGALATAELDIDYEISRARRRLHHLDERVLASYHPSLSLPTR
jgi:predicted amidohydrolase